MSEQKKPEIGEWWEHDSDRVLIVGKTRNGIAIAEYQDGSVYEIENGKNFKHLPDCDSFEWQPETFPQWYVKDDKTPFTDCDHLVRTSKTEVHGINCDGSKTQNGAWSQYHDELVARGDFIQITQAEAESRVKKPEPVESPDDWVTQDRVPDRPGIDEYRWNEDGCSGSEWRQSRKNQVAFLHGTRQDNCTFEVRCRRRDLPPLPQETPKREYVRLVAHRTSGLVFTSPQEALMHLDVYTELKHDGTGFYLEDAR